MKAIVLAGGHATRLWPITKNRAKPLLPLGEKPIIDYIVEELEEDQEVDDIIISTNAKFEEDFEGYIEDFDRNARVVVEDQDSEDEKPGTIGAIIKLLDKEDVDDDLLVIGGDNYYSFDMSDFIDFCKEKDAPCNVAFDVKEESIAKQIGIVDLDEDRIVDFEEKPEEPPSTLGSIAIYYFPREKISLYNEYDQHFAETEIPEDQYLDEPGRLIEWAHKQTDMYAYQFSGHWFDIGTPRGLLDAQEVVMEENIIKGDTENCEIGENVLVLQDAELENVSISNAVVFPESEVKNSDIRNSLIDSHSEIMEADVNDAIIGKHTSL